MNAAPVAAAMASAAEASFRRTFTPKGKATERASSVMTRVIAAMVSGSTRLFRKGRSPKFSTAMASTPPAARASASANARASTSCREPSYNGAPGKGARCTIPMTALRPKRSVKALRIPPADAYPRATEFIGPMVDLVKTLTGRGHTYVADGSTYFRVATMSDYGKLSRVEVDTTSGFSRIEADEYEKESARDL